MKIFISHSSKDKWFADKLVELFEQLDIKFWYDKVDLFIGDVLLRKIQEGLEDCSHLIVVLSQNSVKSKWVREELETFYHDYVENKKAKIYPFLLEDVWEQSPPFLKKLIYADFRGSTEYKLNPVGLAELEKELLGLPIYAGQIFKCRQSKEEYRLFISMPENKSKTELNEIAKNELSKLRTKLGGKDVMVTGRCTYTLGIMIGAFLGNICNSIKGYDPKDSKNLVSIFLPS